MVFCECGKEAIILTSWTNRNPGRRFYGCPDQGSKCRFIGWFDQNQCQRCMDIIPGLLRAKNHFAVENKNLQEQLKALKSETSKMRKMLIFSWIVDSAFTLQTVAISNFGAYPFRFKDFEINSCMFLES
ncbi:hypothetical protein R6Q59_024301 [Mikania micrantha]